MNNKQVKVISDDLNKRMAGYTHSMQPSDDEVSLAFLLCHIDELEKKLGITPSQGVTSLLIHYWADGTWCLAEDLWEYDYMSDDFTILKLPDTTTSEEIEVIVGQRLGIGLTVEVIDTTN